MMKNIEDILETVCDKFDCFEVKNAISDDMVVGYGLKLTTSPERNVENLTPFTDIEYVKPRLCLELDPTQDLELEKYYSRLYSLENERRHFEKRELLPLCFPKYVLENNIIKVYCSSFCLFQIICKKFNSTRNNDKCELKYLNCGNIFKEKFVCRKFIDNGKLYCIISPYKFGIMSAEVKLTLKILYRTLSGKGYDYSAFPYCCYDMDSRTCGVGLWDNGRKIANPLQCTLNKKVKEDIHKLYINFEKQTSNSNEEINISFGNQIFKECTLFNENSQIFK